MRTPSPGSPRERENTERDSHDQEEVAAPVIPTEEEEKAKRTRVEAAMKDDEPAGLIKSLIAGGLAEGMLAHNHVEATPAEQKRPPSIATAVEDEAVLVLLKLLHVEVRQAATDGLDELSPVHHELDLVKVREAGVVLLVADPVEVHGLLPEILHEGLPNFVQRSCCLALLAQIAKKPELAGPLDDDPLRFAPVRWQNAGVALPREPATTHLPESLLVGGTGFGSPLAHSGKNS